MTDTTEVAIEIRCLHASRLGSPRTPAPEVVESVVGEAVPARPGVLALLVAWVWATIVLVSDFDAPDAPAGADACLTASTWCWEARGCRVT